MDYPPFARSHVIGIVSKGNWYTMTFQPLSITLIWEGNGVFITCFWMIIGANRCVITPVISLIGRWQCWPFGKRGLIIFKIIVGIYIAFRIISIWMTYHMLNKNGINITNIMVIYFNALSFLLFFIKKTCV